MAKHDIHRWVFEIPLDDVQTATDDVSVTGGCFLCGKPIKKEGYQVHSLANGNLVSTDQPFADDEDMGFYPIGNECKSKLPNNFVFKVD